MQVFREHKRLHMLFNHSCYLFILATFQMLGGGSSFMFNEAKDLFDDLIKLNPFLEGTDE